MDYIPCVRQSSGYNAFVDFKTIHDANRAERDLDARQDRGDLIGASKPERKGILSKSNKVQLTRERLKGKNNYNALSTATMSKDKENAVPNQEGANREYCYFLRIIDLPFEVTEEDIGELLSGVKL